MNAARAHVGVKGTTKEGGTYCKPGEAVGKDRVDERQRMRRHTHQLKNAATSLMIQ